MLKAIVLSRMTEVGWCKARLTGEVPERPIGWYDGGPKPKVSGFIVPEKWGDGVLFVGDKGMLLADYVRQKLLPEETFKGFAPPKPTIAKSVGHYREWVEACKTGGATTCHFDYSRALTEMVLLGTVGLPAGQAVQLGRRGAQGERAGC